MNCITFSPIFPEILLSGFLLAYAIFGSILTHKSGGWGTSLAFSPSGINQAVFAILIWSFFLSFESSFYYDNNGIFTNTQNDIFRAFTLFLCVFLAATSCYMPLKTSKHFDYALFCIFAIIGSLILLLANDLLTIFVSLELQSLSFYLIAAYNLKSSFTAESGIKYFISGSFASFLLLFGLTAIYFYSGSFLLQVLSFTVDLSEEYFTGFFIGFSFIFGALFFKLGAAPFHQWLNEVYDGAFLNTTTFLMVMPKFAIFVTIIKFSVCLVNSSFDDLLNIFQVFGLSSVIVGSIGALFQRRIRKILIFSTIGHTGFLLFPLFFIWSSSALDALWFYLIIYLATSFSTFSILLVSTVKQGFLKYIISWRNFGEFNIVLTSIFSVLLLSSAGIPPFPGFYSKLLILTILIENRSLVNSIIIITFSTISCFYYLRLIKNFYFTSRKVLLIKLQSNFSFIAYYIPIFTIVIACLLIFPNTLIFLCNLLGLISL